MTKNPAHSIKAYRKRTIIPISSLPYHPRSAEYLRPPKKQILISYEQRPGATTPESLHPYDFADSNPYVYTDPSGEFTLVEINIASFLQFTLHTLRGIVSKYELDPPTNTRSVPAKNDVALE